MEVMGLNVMNAGQVILLMNVGAIAGGPVWGWLSDNVLHTRKWVIAGSTAVLIVILLFLAMLSSETGPVLMMTLFLSFGFFRSSNALMYVHIKETVPTRWPEQP
jgi:sugar phosphate permease